MEYHAVPPEERARTEKGPLPWGIVYKDEARNPRRPPEETGPFGKRRNTRYSSARSGTRTGTPAKRENANVEEFSKLFAAQQEAEQQKLLPSSNQPSSNDSSRKTPDKIATECILYGYRDQASEWKAIDKFERISQGFICEDYPRTDPNIAPKYPNMLSAGDVVVHPDLSADANRKAKVYAGGSHWIKVTFDSSTAADRACHFSPQNLDGFIVHCERYHGHGPSEDVPIPRGSFEKNRLDLKAQTFHPSSTNPFFQSDQPDRATLPRSFTTNTRQVEYPNLDDSNASQQSTVTASSGTITDPTPENNTLRHRQPQQPQAQSEFMTHIPTVRRAVLRPATEALPPQPSFSERVIRSIPILSWFSGDIVGDGPVLFENGAFDYDKSNLYWRFWYTVDKLLGTDLCGLKEDS